MVVGHDPRARLRSVGRVFLYVLACNRQTITSTGQTLHSLGDAPVAYESAASGPALYVCGALFQRECVVALQLHPALSPAVPSVLEARVYYLRCHVVRQLLAGVSQTIGILRLFHGLGLSNHCVGGGIRLSQHSLGLPQRIVKGRSLNSGTVSIQFTRCIYDICQSCAHCLRSLVYACQPKVINCNPVARGIDSLEAYSHGVEHEGEAYAVRCHNGDCCLLRACKYPGSGLISLGIRLLYVLCGGR